MTTRFSATSPSGWASGLRFSVGRDARGWIDGFLEESEVPDATEFRRTGIYAGAEQRRIGLGRFAADPEHNPLPTPSGRIELASEACARQGLPQVPEYRGGSPSERYPLHLVTPHARYRINSQYGSRSGQRWPGTSEPVAPPPGRGTPAGSRRRYRRSGQRSGPGAGPGPGDRGDHAGVSCLLAGAWPVFAADGVDTGGCANVLTSTVPTLPSRGSRTHTVFVEVTPVQRRRGAARPT